MVRLTAVVLGSAPPDHAGLAAAIEQGRVPTDGAPGPQATYTWVAARGSRDLCG